MVVFTLILLGVLTFLLYYWISNRKKLFSVLKECGYPGPEPNLFFGNMGQIRPPWSQKLCYQIPVMTEWHKKYGRVFGYYTGALPKIVTTDLELIRSIFVKESHNFTNRGNPQNGNQSLIEQKDEKWKNTRRVLTPTFSGHKLKQMLHLMESCDEILFEIIDTKLKAGNSDIEVVSMLQDLTMDVIFKAALAMDVDCQRKANPMVQSLKDFFNFYIPSVVIVRMMFPSMKKVFRLLMGMLSKQQKAFVSLSENLKQVIEHRRSLEDSTNYRDILQLLLEAAEGKHEVEKKEEMSSGEGTDTDTSENSGTARKRLLLTDKEIIDNSIVFLLAGYETTSTALSYVMYCLAKYPDVQERVLEEVEGIIGDKGHITYEDLSKMVYLEQTLYETMRMYPPVVAFVHRKCKRTTEVNGWRIPRGAIIEAPTWLLHHDPEYWDSPEEFNPERFAPENRKQEHQLAFTPFGIGPRKCIGERFATIEAKLCIAKIVQRYRILPSDKNKEPLSTIVRTVIMNPKDGIWVRFESRNKRT